MSRAVSVYQSSTTIRRRAVPGRVVRRSARDTTSSACSSAKRWVPNTSGSSFPALTRFIRPGVEEVSTSPVVMVTPLIQRRSRCRAPACRGRRRWRRGHRSGRCRCRARTSPGSQQLPTPEQLLNDPASISVSARTSCEPSALDVLELTTCRAAEGQQTLEIEPTQSCAIQTPETRRPA